MNFGAMNGRPLAKQATEYWCVEGAINKGRLTKEAALNRIVIRYRLRPEWNQISFWKLRNSKSSAAVDFNEASSS